MRGRLAPALIAGAVFALTARPAPAPDASPSAAPAVKAGYERAAAELLCYCGCARQTVRECTCGVAFDLRADFERRLATGETPETIVASYIAEHGEQSRNVPPKKGLNLLAWFGPGAGILAAGVVVLLVLRRWARNAPARLVPASGPPTELDDELRRRVEQELREFDR